MCGPRPSLLTIVLLAVATAVAAQDAILEQQEADLVVEVVLAPDLAPVAAERVLIREEGAVLQTIAEADDVEGSVTFPDAMIYNFKPYIVSAWVDGVGYHARHGGQAFLDGKPARVIAFPTSDDRDGLQITGLNVVVRRQARGFALEYIATVANRGTPQRTVVADALPIRLVLPRMAELEVEIDRGPDPLTADLRPAAEDLTGVAIALPPGEARITVRGLLEAGDEAVLEIGADPAVAQWSLLAWPADIRVRSADLSRDDGHGHTEFARWRGPALAPADRVEVALGAPAPAVAQDVFSAAAPRQAPAEEDRPDRRPRRFPWLTVTAAVVLVSAYLVWRARR
jgi:hypothetical protein